MVSARNAVTNNGYSPALSRPKRIPSVTVPFSRSDILPANPRAAFSRSEFVDKRRRCEPSPAGFF